MNDSSQFSFFHAMNRKNSFGFLVAVSITLALLLGSFRSFGQIQVYTDRAAWEAALTTVVNEDLESVTTDFSLANSFNMNAGASITVGTHTFTGSIDWPAAALDIDAPPLEGHSQFANSTQISWWGTTQGSPRTKVSIPSSFGIGFDWKATGTSYGSHNSIYLQASGNSGSIYRLLNPIDGGASTPAEGFIGIISPCGGIDDYDVFTSTANWQGFSIDNFAYGSISPLPDTDGDGTADCNEDCPLDPDKLDPGACGCGIADVDADNDGSMLCDDCDDNNPAIYPGATENMTNGIDDNCDGLTDLPSYCVVAPSYACSYMWITNVTMGSINNTTTCTSGGYSVYSAPSVLFSPGEVYNISITAGGIYDQRGSVFIDWNADGDFSDTDEQVVTSILLPRTGVAGSASFTVPASIGSGQVLMRVISDYSNPGACFSYYGEVENYIVALDGCKDSDGDGFTDATCGGTDCDDTDPAISPNTVWYKDTDNDGFSNGATLTQCTQPAGYKLAGALTATTGDCNDTDNSIYPAATDLCDSKDNDCDGTTDEGGNTVHPGWTAGNVGGATNTGSSFTCSSGSGSGTVFAVNAQGFSGAANADLLFSDYQQRCGDASITVHLSGNPSPGWAGIYMRESLAAGSKMVALKTNITGFLRRETRTTTGGNKTTSQSPLYAANTWLRIDRTGNAFSFYTSSNGATWTFFGSSTIVMSSCIYLGIFAESINAATTVTASFDNVSITGTLPLVAAPQQEVVRYEQPALDVVLYPNPSSGDLNLKMNTPALYGQPLQISIVNALGSKMWAGQLDGVEGTQQLSSLPEMPDGIYWVQIQAPGFAPAISRVVIQR